MIDLEKLAEIDKRLPKNWKSDDCEVFYETDGRTEWTCDGSPADEAIFKDICEMRNQLPEILAYINRPEEAYKAEIAKRYEDSSPCCAAVYTNIALDLLRRGEA